MNVLRELGEQFGRSVLEGIGRTSSRVQERKPLSVDLLENDDAFLAVFDAPGVTSSDIDVRFDDHVIHVRVDRFREIHEDFEMRLPGRGMSLSGSVSLPENVPVDDEAATATVTTSGTLCVEIPKTDSGSTDEPIPDSTDEPIPDSTDEPIRIETGSNSDDADDSNGSDDSDDSDESDE
jgi:HSP20 family protein